MQNNAKGIPTDSDVGTRGTCYGEILTQQLGSISRWIIFLRPEQFQVFFGCLVEARLILSFSSRSFSEVQTTIWATPDQQEVNLDGLGGTLLPFQAGCAIRAVWGQKGSD